MTVFSISSPLLFKKGSKVFRQSNMHKKLNQELNTLSCKLWEGRFGVEMVTIYFTLVVRNAKKWFLSKRILITFLGMTLILITITQKRNHEKSVNKCQKKILLLQEKKWKMKLKFISWNLGKILSKWSEYDIDTIYSDSYSNVQLCWLIDRAYISTHKDICKYWI